MQNPANAGRQQGSMQIASLAASKSINTLKIAPSQSLFAATWITRRVPVSLVVARHIAELHGLGGANG